MSASNLSVAGFVLFVGGFLVADAKASDWPQFRYDAGRTAASPTELATELHLQWRRQLSNPRPTFPSEVRLRFDASYEPVVLRKSMFVPSMVTDSVTALDTDTGSVRWRFFTDGPVRFAPVAHDSKVYAASDDGFLYCLAAESGELIWKFRGLPADRQDRKLLGNRRLISLWPARGGPVLVGGVLYFAAGIWPSDGVFVYALDAKTGAAVWSNTTSNRIPRANMDHGVAQYAGLTPQGYLAMVSDKLVVPCGAQLAAFLDPKTGTLGDYSMGWGGRNGLPKGSWFVAGAGRFLSHSGDLFDITKTNDEKFRDPRGRPDFKKMLYPGGFTRLMIDPNNQRALGPFPEPVITGQELYLNDSEAGIVAYDLTDFELQQRSKLTPTKSRAGDKYPDRWKANLRRIWSLPSKLKVHIKAGSRLYVGGPGVVQAIQMPQGTEKPSVNWQAKIEGTPNRMLAADGKLFVVTLEGRIYAFGKARPKEVRSHQPSATPPRRDESWAKRADAILKETEQTEGYALVLGVDTGHLVEELIAKSGLYVIAIDQDASKVAELRNRLHRAGRYGTRAAVHVGDPRSYPFPPYLASLIVSENDASLVTSLGDSLGQRLAHPLRPYGGTVCLSKTIDQRDALVRRLTAFDRPGVVVRQTDEFVLLQRKGALPDAADWSHAGGNAANAGASQDRFLRAPLGMLWYDSSLRWQRKPGSAVVRVAGGRVFVLAEYLYAIDVYTGRHLWRVDVPAKIASKGEIVATSDKVHLAIGRECRVLDAATGETRHRFTAPPDTSGDWSNLRVSDKHLVATIGKHLVCLDRGSRTAIWKFPCGRQNLSVAVGGGKVFCAELVNQRRGETTQKAGTKIRGLNINDGEVVWEVPGGRGVHYSDELDLLVTSAAVYQGSNGKRLRDGVASPQIIGDKIVSGTTDHFAVYDAATGKSSGDELQWYRRGCTGLRSSCHLVTTRFKANAAYVDLETRSITSLWNIRPGCNNNLFPANGILNVPNVTGGCECNYTPTSKAFVPQSVIISGPVLK